MRKTGLKNIPEENGFHPVFPIIRDFFDMLAIIEACPKALCVVFKKEVAEIILVKQIARLLRAIQWTGKM